MTQPYHLPNIRALLTQGFDDQQLRQLAFDWPEFRPVYEKLSAETRKDVLVQLLLEHAERSLQLDGLLALAQRLNPARFAAHQPYFDRPRLETELAKVEDNLAAQQKLAGILPERQLETVRRQLQAKQASLRALLAFQNEGGLNLGQQAQAVVNSPVGRDVIGPGASVTYIHRQEIHQNSESSKMSEARLRYLRRLAQRCNVLPLAALGGEEGAEEDLTLDRVYIDLDTTTPLPLAETEKKKRSGGGREADTRPLTALEAAHHPRLALLGDPGAGKSTFVHQLLAWLAAANLGQADPPPGLPGDLLPILLTLRDLAPALAELNLAALPGERQPEALAAVVRRQAQADLERLEAGDFAAGLQEALVSGRCVLALDGLDEVPYQLRPRIRAAVGAVIAQYRPQRIIITCRVRSYVGQAVLPNFQAHTLAPFDEAKVTAFGRAWYRAQQELGRVEAAQARAKAGNLIEAALSEDLRELSQNPMLLTTMALIHQREIGLPRERVRLYNLAVEVLLSRWQKRKSGEAGLALSPSLAEFLKDNLRLRQVMERLAYAAHRARRGGTQATDLPRGEALLLLERPEYLGEAGLAAEFLDYVDQRAGLLLGRGGEPNRPAAYSFPHRTFQEYLAACYLISRSDVAREFFACAGQGDEWGLAAQLGAEELLYQRRLPPALLGLAYRLCPAAAPATPQAQRAALWAGRMAALVGSETIERDGDSPDGGPAYLQRLIPALLSLFSGALSLPERAAAGLTLGRLGDPRPGVTTLPPALTAPLEGDFLYGEGKTQKRLTLPPFQAGVYPVTNAQFGYFIQAGGYHEPRWWSPEGWQWRQGEPRYNWQKMDRPDYWEQSRWNQPNQPVVGVTWYEAEAFCNWLTATNPIGRVYRLPSEAEWERLARGREGWQYPWGNKWQEGYANTAEGKLGQASPVGLFAAGVSPGGVYDCAGNVWEWCADWYDDSQTGRVLRGGSWDDSEDYARCAVRGWNDPDYGDDCIGFRVVSAIV